MLKGYKTHMQAKFDMEKYRSKNDKLNKSYCARNFLIEGGEFNV